MRRGSGIISDALRRSYDRLIEHCLQWLLQRDDEAKYLTLMMVAIYFALTAYSLSSAILRRKSALPLREAVSPFQIKARARNAGAERSAAA